ncbi:helix-turn-helix transcriptional regulator [Chloroflexota bacterium]
MGTRRKKVQWNADAVRGLRRHMGLTQQELASEMGVRQQTISDSCLLGGSSGLNSGPGAAFYGGISAPGGALGKQAGYPENTYFRANNYNC